MLPIPQTATVLDQLSGRQDFGSFYDAYSGKIYAYIFRKTSHRETAEDLTSQTFFKAMDKFSQFDPQRGTLSSWIYGIARNAVIDHYRSKKEFVDINTFSEFAGKADPLSDYEMLEKAEQARKVLSALSPEKRELVELRLWEDLSFKEISRITGKSEAGCKMAFSRVLKEVRKKALPAICLLIGCCASSIWIK
jgi:RNA polymerase sigma-70 factor (ECF subfamily)